VFKDDTDSSVPVVIYMPRVSDKNLWKKKKYRRLLSMYKSIDGFNVDKCVTKGFCKTANFQYKREQSEQLIDQMEFNVVVNRARIIHEIRLVVAKKTSRLSKQIVGE
jgi:hypothetical protein